MRLKADDTNPRWDIEELELVHADVQLDIALQHKHILRNASWDNFIIVWTSQYNTNQAGSWLYRPGTHHTRQLQAGRSKYAKSMDVAEQKVAVYTIVLSTVKSCKQEYLRYSFKIF